MSCGSWCVYFRDKPSGICRNCSNYTETAKSRFEFERLDFRKMAEGLAIKEGRIIFFSHSLTTYYTQTEKLCLEFIHENYPNYYVINPRDIALERHWDFDTCMKHILPEVQRCKILFWYKDDSYSPGVDMEIAEARRLDKSVRELILCHS